MKRKVLFITAAVLAILMSSTGVYAQEGTQKSTDEKQKQAEALKQAEAKKQAEFQKQQQVMNEEMKLKQAEMEAKRKEIQEKVAEIEAKNGEKRDEMVFFYKDFENIGERVRDYYRNAPVVVMPDMPDIQNIDTHAFDNIYLYRGHGYSSKPGSAWNYSRQVMEATFTNELTMSAGDESNVNLSVSGDCAEGSIVVAIIMPDGKQLSEVIIDENGSLNWRKNFEAGANNGWKNGKWTFRIKAKDATGNLRISMNSD
jgi:hypothetical protein